MPPKIKIEFCTSCGSQEVKVTGNKYYCPVCDITYIVTVQGTKVIDTNPLSKEKARLDHVIEEVAKLKGKKEPGAEPVEPAESAKPAEPAAGGDEDAHDSGQDGFISIEE